MKLRMLLALLCSLGLVGCTTAKQEARNVTSYYLDGNTNVVDRATVQEVTVKITSILGGKQTLETAKASAGKTLTAGQTGTQQDSGAEALVKAIEVLGSVAQKAATVAK